MMRIRFNVTGGNAIINEHFFMRKLELAQVKKQIEVLATFLPDEILQLKQDKARQTYEYVGVLLFADVSGFTQLTEKYNKTGKGGIYRLTATLNAYIGAIVEVICFYGGDVLKFSGDAFLALWKVNPDESLFEILHGVVVCALVIQQTLGRFETEVNVELKVKLAISCGNMTFCVIGDQSTKNYIIAGEAINDVKGAEHVSQSGDVVISPGAWAHMLKERYEITDAAGGNVKVWKVVYKASEFRKKLYFDEKQTEVLKLVESHLNHRNELHAKRKFDSSMTNSKITEKFVRSLPQRPQMKLAPKNWIVEDLRSFIIKPVENQVEESQPVEYLTEMREITTQFINIVPYSYYEPVLTELVDKAYQIVCTIAGSARGVVNKVSLFDKDIMILVLFGLRAINHEMETQNALRSAYKIYTLIRKLNGVKSVSIGVTNGFVYCGVVGHPMRREYTVIGGAVNKAARIMCSYIEKVTCDHKCYKNSKLSSFYFQLETTVKLKGIEDAGNIFEYNENFDASFTCQTISAPIVGRNEEYNFIKALIYNPRSVDDCYGVCFEGPSKIGKSKLLDYTMKAFKKNGYFSIASVCLEGSSLIPYFCISKLYRQLYDNRTTIDSHHVLEIVQLPRDLWNVPDMLQDFSEDIALQKYRVLNYFRDLTNFTSCKTTLIFIDNIEHIDIQSWEILEIVLCDRNIRLIMTGYFEDKFWDLRFKISICKYLRLLEMRRLQTEQIATISCQFLAVAGIPNTLVNLLVKSCEGRPGYVQCCLLRLVNNGSIELELITKTNDYSSSYMFPHDEITKDKIISIIKFSEKYKKSEELTLAAISLDLFDSFTPYEQLVLKTGAVLGDLFTRTLLIVALKYPAESTLAKVIQHFFEEEILECGSRYVYATEIDTTRCCCQCYYEEYPSSEDMLPKYAYCKILHFKNKSIRDVAYDLLPGNQRKELHLLCTDVLENMNNQCPNCLKNPFSSFINLGKFNEIMEFCNTPNLPFNKEAPSEYCEGMKDCIRKSIRRPESSTLVPHKKSAGSEIFGTRTLYDIKLCNCYEILTRIYKDLIYHSKRAGHLGKQIFFTMQYGLLLIILKDYVTAITLLTEARELCLKDARLPDLVITQTFKSLLVGKIQLGLAKASISLRQIRAARDHLAIALRQYHIPSVALYYKHFSQLLARSYLVNAKRVRPYTYRNTIIRTDTGICLGYCAKLFSLEGNWKLARFAAAYSVYLLHTVNSNVAVLYEVYCTAINIYRFCSDYHTCHKLQKFTIKEFLSNYSSGLTFNVHSIHFLLDSMFELRWMKGQIIPSIRLGYRVFDIGMKLSLGNTMCRPIERLTLALAYNFRLKECVDACKVLKKFHDNDIMNQMMYYATCLFFYIRTGFTIEPIEVILKFGDSYFTNKQRCSWGDHFFIAAIHVHHLHMGHLQTAEKWRPSASFNYTNVKGYRPMRTLLLTLEGKILLYIRSSRMGSPNAPMDRMVIQNLLKLMEHQIRNYEIFQPVFLCLSAWMETLNKRPKKGEKLLDKAIKIARQQENLLYECFAIQLKNAWHGGFHYRYDSRPSSSYVLSNTFTLREWAQYMSPFPLY